ncbi:MAG: tetratricopeptide repeat protein [Deltaproteobacteria bacterium]|nr:tetratricopeptide repeat protein [Deltaproteobacteria bacterium]MBW2138774.1 tetratricopeptide repeat protein [Deltaproteobacteria bacterium]
MKQKARERKGYVKKETLLIVSVISLVVGFIIGAVFSSYKYGSEGGPPGKIESPAQTPAMQVPEVNVRSRIEVLESEISRNPDKLEMLIELGNAYFDTNQYDKAVETYRMVLDIDPNNANVWTDMGIMYRRRGEPAKALEAFDRATAVDPDHEISRFNKGIVLLHDMNDVNGAVKAWEGLVERNPFAKAPNGQLLVDLISIVKEGNK